MTAPPVRIRFRYSKHGKVRFCSHRDLARIWERALRRAGLPVAYSEGFSPRPKLSFGLALSTGYESAAEYVDVNFAEAVGIDGLCEALSSVMPAGIDVQAAVRLEPGTKSLQESVVACSWRIDVAEPDGDVVGAWVERLLDASSIVVTRERKGKPVTDDLRPQVLGLDVDGPCDSGTRLTAVLGTQPRALRPSELLTSLEPSQDERRVERTHQWIELDGEPGEPIPIAAAVAPRTLRGAM